jgi:hypothetical protein
MLAIIHLLFPKGLLNFYLISLILIKFLIEVAGLGKITLLIIFIISEFLLFLLSVINFGGLYDFLPSDLF